MVVPLIIAHRTCPRDGPENSLAGIRRAAALGADVVEVDVRRARDGVPVLLHDPLLVRTTLWPFPVRSVPSAMVGRMRLRRGHGETVPTLAAALDRLPDGLRVAVDVKDRGAMPAVVDAGVAAGRLDRMLLWSQHVDAVKAAVRLAPQAEVALLRDTVGAAETAAYIEEAAALGAAAVSVHEAVLTARLVADTHAMGLRVYCWIQDVGKTNEAAATALDGLVTDWPAVTASAISG